MRKNLKLFRVAQGMTQEEISDKIGVSRTTYNSVERGDRGGDIVNFWGALQRAFDIPLEKMGELQKLDD